MRLFAGVCLALWAVFANAMFPDSGWYWNPAESGRGFNIEIQNNSLFMAGFVYDAQGNAIWLVTGGPMSTDHTYSGDVYQTSGGQCIGCAYQGPLSIKYGTATITFTSETTAVIAINGVAINTRREEFGIDLANPATPLLGEWATTEGSTILPLYFGERMTLTHTQVATSSGLTAYGTRTGDTARPVVGSFITANGEYAFLLDSSTSYYRVYSFRFVGLNRIEGIESTFLKTSSPSGYSDFVGSRIKSAARAAGANAPGTEKAAIFHDQSEQDALRARNYETGKAIPTQLKAAVESLLSGRRM